MIVYAVVPKEYHASYYYRLVLPLETMEEMGLPIKGILDDLSPSVPNHKRVTALTHSDINLFYQPTGAGLLANVQAINSWKTVKTDDGRKWKTPPSFVVDTDDNLFAVSPWNPAYAQLGIRTTKGVPLQPGDEVGYVDQSGNDVVLFRDGANGFSLAENQRRLQTYADICSAADAVTCSTPRVKAYVEAETAAREVFVFPNSMRFDHYPSFRDITLAKRDDKRIRILWQGSPTHYEDLHPLREALGSVAKRNPEVMFIFWGALYPWVTSTIPPDQFQHIPWCKYDQYKLRLSLMLHDINLCPLRPSMFNDSRSAIKFYESSVLAYPAATLAQRFGAYEDDIIDGQTGLLWDTPADFAEKLNTLVQDAKLRKELASNAKDWLKDNRDAFKTVPKLHEFYERLREERIKRTPRATEEEMDELRKQFEKERAEEAKEVETFTPQQPEGMWAGTEVP